LVSPDDGERRTFSSTAGRPTKKKVSTADVADEGKFGRPPTDPKKKKSFFKTAGRLWNEGKKKSLSSLVAHTSPAPPTPFFFGSSPAWDEKFFLVQPATGRDQNDKKKSWRFTRRSTPPQRPFPISFCARVLDL
jgi:hypothetical protein